MSSRMIAESAVRNYLMTCTTERRYVSRVDGMVCYARDIYMIEVYRKEDDGNQDARPVMTFRTSDYMEAREMIPQIATLLGDSLVYAVDDEVDDDCMCVGFCHC